MAANTLIGELVVSIPYGTSGQVRYQKVGAVFQVANNDPSKGPGFMVLLDRTFNPAGAPITPGHPDNVALSVYHPKPKESRPGGPFGSYILPPKTPRSQDNDMDDDIPF